MNVTEATTTTENIIVDTATRPKRLRSSFWQIVLRLSLIVSSSIAIAWSLFDLQASWSESRLIGVTERIMAGDAFKADTLRELEPFLVAASDASFSKPKMIRSVAVIRLRQAELELSAGGDVAQNAAVPRADAALRRALLVLPTDAFLWFGLAWLTRATDGLNDQVLTDLRMSYETGEHEGWVAVHRNALSVSILSSLPDDLQLKAVREFRNLVEANYIAAAAEILAGPGWAQHERLLADLEDVPVDIKLQLARAVVDLGFDILVPGVERQASRPWK